MAESGVGGAMEDESGNGSIGVAFMIVLIPGKVMLDDGRKVGCLSDEDSESSKMEDMRGNEGEEGGVKRADSMSSPLRTRLWECAIVCYFSLSLLYLICGIDKEEF